MRARIPLIAIAASVATTAVQCDAAPSRYYSRQKLHGLATPAPAGPSCGTLTAKKWGNDSGGAGNKIGAAMSLATAQSVCNTYLASSKKTGTCFWNSASGSLYSYAPQTVYFQPGVAISTALSDFYGASCSP